MEVSTARRGDVRGEGLAGLGRPGRPPAHRNVALDKNFKFCVKVIVVKRKLYYLGSPANDDPLGDVAVVQLAVVELHAGAVQAGSAGVPERIFL